MKSVVVPARPVDVGAAGRLVSTRRNRSIEAFCSGLLALPLLAAGAAPGQAQSITRSAAYNPVPQVDNASDSRSLDFGAAAIPVGSIDLSIDFTKCDNPISATGVCIGTGTPYYTEIGFTLAGPTGLTSELVIPDVTFTEIGRGPGGTFTFTFSNAATTPVSDALQDERLVSGTYAPATSLEKFLGRDGAGLWTLTFIDADGSDPLSLNAWSLTLKVLGIIPGLPALASAPYSTTFAGGTLIVDQPGTYSQNWQLGPFATNSLDQAGVNSTFSGVFSGAGGINLINSGFGGRVEFTGANTYTGPTTVQGGAQLAVNGSIASSSELRVLAGGRISGTGQLPRTTIHQGGILSPGNSIGTLNVAGDFAFQDGLYELELQGPQSDSVAVSGNVSVFNGTARLIPFGGGTAFPGFRYVALSAPNSNPFASSGSLNLDASLLNRSVVLRHGTRLVQNSSRDPRRFDVQFKPRDSAGAVSAALKATGGGRGNALQSAGVFDSGFRRLVAAANGNANASGSPIGSTGFTTGQAAAAGLSPEFLQLQASLLALTTPAQLNAAMQAISPETYASFQAVALNSLQLQREALFSQASSCPANGWVVGGEPGKTARQPVCVFATGGNTTGNTTGRSGRSSYDSAIAAGLYGLEWKTAPAWTIGAAYGYGSANLSGLGIGENSVHSVVNTGTLYGVYSPSADWAIKGLLAYSNFNLNGSRHAPVLGNGDDLTGRGTGQGYTAAIQAEFSLPLNGANSSLPLTLKPLLGLAYGAYQQRGFQEAGNEALALDVSQHTAQSVVGSLGAELSTRITISGKDNHLLIPKLKLAYQLDPLANDSGNYSLDASVPAAEAGLSAVGQSNGANTLSLGGSVEVQIADRAALYAGANFQTFENGDQFTYGGGVKLNF